ncbi:phosphorylase family protein [Streptomyces sudanensis]|uniref:phosphorylase family protein n=1 Tax=Streptomyces sudanensis TaxID=436397 RepID=UPI0020CF53CE|nr:1-hydroxy-2-methyl-2-butenyl 4-diphosphate reductase [Streptomyces sudanensis]MCP9956475.1 1-hydroxy-2-methyl-2-butenyl 4-diphosphate reductase [Streptomyces sudanensis]MCQ0002912.1 1-hydroxy-2-methyl-2-butenyl 4-diphosphate reductase [Streptomyces sudanensis]
MARGPAPGGPSTRSPAAPPAPPLLVACALGVEHLALRGGRAAGGGAVLLRTGMGPGRARRAVAGALRGGPLRAAAVVASGFCAGLAPGMRPGDLVVADETRGPHGAARCTDPGALAAALARALPGATVHTGPLTGSDHVVRGRERTALRAAGALAVDMESAAVLHAALAAGPRPVAAVRVVVDAPGHELVRIGTVRGGMAAFRVLRAVLPALREWHRSLPPHRR